MKGLFGPICYAVGPIIVGIAVIIAIDKEDIEVKNKIWQMAILLILLCGFSQIFYGLPLGSSFFGKLIALWVDGVSLNSGGILASVLGWPLLRYCGTAGASIILLLLTFVFLMLITGSTLMGFFKTCAKPVKQMEESYTQFKEQREEKKKSKFNIDVALDDEDIMPEHPVSSPNAVFEDDRTSEVIDEIFAKYPVLSQVTNQKEIIDWLDETIDNALKEMRKIFEENAKKESESSEVIPEC